MKNVLSLLLVITLLCSSLFSFVYAEENAARSSNYFISYGTSMSAPGGGGINITFKAVGTGICNQIGVANYYVQRLDDNGNWYNVSSTLSGQTGTNVASYTFGRYFQGVAGETYRIQVTFYCAIGNGSEHKSYTSGRITAK
jgi:hypothetical protein